MPVEAVRHALAVAIAIARIPATWFKRPAIVALNPARFYKMLAAAVRFPVPVFPRMLSFCAIPIAWHPDIALARWRHNFMACGRRCGVKSDFYG